MREYDLPDKELGDRAGVPTGDVAFLRSGVPAAENYVDAIFEVLTGGLALNLVKEDHVFR